MTRAAWAAMLCLILGGASAGADEVVEVLRVPEGGIQPQAVIDEAGTIHTFRFAECIQGRDAQSTVRALQGTTPQACGVGECRSTPKASEYIPRPYGRGMYRDMVLLTSRDGGRTFSNRTIDRF